MGAFFEKVAAINGSINGVVWGIFGLALLIVGEHDRIVCAGPEIQINIIFFFVSDHFPDQGSEQDGFIQKLGDIIHQAPLDRRIAGRESGLIDPGNAHLFRVQEYCKVCQKEYLLT